MRVGPPPEQLLYYAEATGASQNINKWVDKGNEFSIRTGKPIES